MSFAVSNASTSARLVGVLGVRKECAGLASKTGTDVRSPFTYASSPPTIRTYRVAVTAKLDRNAEGSIVASGGRHRRQGAAGIEEPADEPVFHRFDLVELAPPE